MFTWAELFLCDPGSITTRLTLPGLNILDTDYVSVSWRYLHLSGYRSTSDLIQNISGYCQQIEKWSLQQLAGWGLTTRVPNPIMIKTNSIWEMIVRTPLVNYINKHWTNIPLLAMLLRASSPPLVCEWPTLPWIVPASSAVHAVLGGLSPVLLPPLGEDQPPLDGAGLRRHLHRHPGLLRPRSLLHLLLQQRECWGCFYGGRTWRLTSPSTSQMKGPYVVLLRSGALGVFVWPVPHTSSEYICLFLTPSLPYQLNLVPRSPTCLSYQPHFSHIEKTSHGGEICFSHKQELQH